MLRLLQVRLPLDHSDDDLVEAIMKIAKIKKVDLLKTYRIHKRSVDARNRHRPAVVYAIDIDIDNESDVLRNAQGTNILKIRDGQSSELVLNKKEIPYRPVIVGAGPAGLFVGLLLSELGMKPIILERGKPVDERTADVKKFMAGQGFDPHSNISFGEGGAGTFSDGKLYTLINDPRTKRVFDEFIKSGAPAEIAIESKPHIGTDRLRDVVKNLRQRIVNAGGEFRFNARVTDVVVDADRHIEGVVVDGKDTILSKTVFFAVGSSASDTFEMLYARGVDIQQKPFSIGVRIEHPQAVINHAQYGTSEPDVSLGQAEYKLVYHSKSGRSAYTFCMCPGGFVVPAQSDAGTIVTNGMSEFSRNAPNANSAIVVGFAPGDFMSEHPLAGLRFRNVWEQKAFEAGGGNYAAPVQLVGDFLANRSSKSSGVVMPTYKPGICFSNMAACLPDYVVATLREAIPAFNDKIKGFSMNDAVLTGVETRTSCPVRIVRDQSCQSSIKGLMPIGEGAGYAGGIISAALDGIRAVEAFLSRL